jgi:hypothetical protein
MILATVTAVMVIGFAALALATAPSTQASHYANYTLVIDPDAVDRVQLNLPAESEYEEDLAGTHGTRSPAVYVFQDNILYPNKNSGWHYHPGIVLATVAAGSIEWYDAKCVKHVRVAGDSFMEEDKQLHLVRNVNSVPARTIFTFVIAKGLTYKIYAPAPPCAAALGLN